MKYLFFLSFVVLHSSFCISFAAPTGHTGSAYQYYLKALLLESQGNFADAHVEVERALDLAPESAYLHRTAAELSLRLGQINTAAKEIDKANQLDPTDVRGFIIAGQIHWALGDAEKAEVKLKKAVALDPDEGEALVSLAGTLTPQKPEEAIHLYKDFLVRHPNEMEILERLAQLYQVTGNFKAAQETWEEALGASPNSVRAHLALAQIAEINFDTFTAISHYEGVLEQDPTNLPLLLRVGELRYRNNDMAHAMEAFSKAQSIAPSSASANFWLALLAENRGDWVEAIRLLKQVPDGDQEPGVLLRLSYYYSQVGSYKEAVKVLKKLSDANPGNTDFLNYLAIAYEQDKQYANAEKALRKIIDTDPNDADAHFHLATLYDRTGRFPKAENELKAAIDLRPDFHMALNYLGYSYAEKSIHLDEAEKLLNDAVALDPENAAYLDSLGWLCYRQGKLQKAKDFLREATLRARDPVIWEHLGDVQVANLEPVDAILSWDESLRAADTRKVRSKMRWALRRITNKEKLGLFVERAVSYFGDVDAVNGLVSITVCEEKPPCFESKAKFSYAHSGELTVEIPGPFMGPVMLLTKEHGLPAKYGAIHPQFQTVEFYVTRAFDRIEALLSADLFRKSDLNALRENVVEAGGMLSARSNETSFQFNSRSGAVKRIDWQEESLEIGDYAPHSSNSLPKYLKWRDAKTKFSIRVEFLKPAVASGTSPAKVHP